jgi:hypothetical protein
MRRLRRPVVLRLCAVGLLASLGLALAAPVAAAGRTDDTAAWLALDAIPQATLEAALKAAAGADSPEAYAGALASALQATLGEAAPPADALLEALYGQLFRVLQEEVGARAIVVPAGSAGAVEGGPVGALSPALTAAPRPFAALTAGEGQALPPTPRALRPALQPLGP